VLSILFRSVLGEGDSIVTATPTYSLYPTLAALLGARVEAVPVREDWQMDLPRMQQFMQARSPVAAISDRKPLAIITNPNAPTGLVESREAVLSFAQDNPALTLVDEAYADFGTCSVASLAGAAEYTRLLVCGTFSKTYSLAGGRVGWLLAHPRMIAELDKIRDSYNINRLTQAAALAALRDQGELARRIDIIVANRAYLMTELARLGFFTLPGQANFVFTRPPERLRQTLNHRLPDGTPVDSIGQLYYEHLKARKILVRHFPGPRTDEFVRITIGNREQMERLIRVTADLLA
jgi:histidinol-phosphate aminotransferase